MAEAFYRYAIGYTRTEDKVMEYNGEIITARTTKHHPPSTRPGIFWLLNRQPEKWKDRKAGEITPESAGIQLDFR